MCSLIRMNDEAVALMSANELNSAAWTLQQCLSALEKAWEDAEDDEEEDEEMDCSVESEASADSSIFTFRPSSSAHSPITRVQDHPTSFTVYNRAMALQLRVKREQCAEVDISDLSEEDYSLLISVLLFNFGLCLHLQGAATGCSQQLKDALDAYDEALGLLGLVEQGLHSSMLELALLNNHSHITSYFLVNTHSVRQSLDRMRLVLYAATFASPTKTVPPVLSPFAQNILFNANQHARPAPVA